jgi:hypothetical protein
MYGMFMPEMWVLPAAWARRALHTDKMSAVRQVDDDSGIDKQT